MSPANVSSESAWEQKASLSSNDRLSISGSELDRTASGLQHISHEAGQWKVLQHHSKLDPTPLEWSSENNPHLRYGHEHLEANREDDDKEAPKGQVDHKHLGMFDQHYDSRIKHLTSTDPRTPKWVESPIYYGSKDGSLHLLDSGYNGTN